MNFNEAKKYIYDIYSKKGFTNIIVDNETSWMLKNNDINNAYISLSKKNNTIKS